MLKWIQREWIMGPYKKEESHMKATEMKFVVVIQSYTLYEHRWNENTRPVKYIVLDKIRNQKRK